MSEIAQQLLNDILPPSNTGRQLPAVTATTASAATVDLFGHLAAADYPSGRFVISLTPIESHVWVRFKSANATATVASSNGFPVIQGQTTRFICGPVSSRYMEVVGNGNVNLYRYISSPSPGPKKV